MGIHRLQVSKGYKKDNSPLILSRLLQVEGGYILLGCKYLETGVSFHTVFIDV